jgi:serine acetyltransferase
MEEATKQPVATTNGAQPATPPRLGMWALMREDYRAFSRLRGDSSSLKRRILFLPRLLINPSLHAVVLLRLTNGSPPWLHWLWRNILIWKHSMDLAYRCEIGPGLFLPHPHTISMAPGVTIGARCRIAHMTNFGAQPGDEHGPVIGDGVVVFMNASVIGDLTIGDGCVVGAHAMVTKDMPPGSLAIGPKSTIVEGKGSEILASGHIIEM